jgi:hypothetical protein
MSRQDDDKQKESEIAQMSRTYKNVTAVIMASVASSVFDGFLRMDREPHLTSLLDWASFWSESQVKNPVVRTIIPGGFDGNLKLARETANDKKFLLDSRAWAIQESLLATLKLDFSSPKLFVECLEHSRGTIHKGSVDYTMNSIPGLWTWNWSTADCINR